MRPRSGRSRCSPPPACAAAKRWRRPASTDHHAGRRRGAGPVCSMCMGDVQDLGAPLPTDTPRWPIHRRPPPLAAQTAHRGDVRNRHQGDRPAGAARPGRQGRDVRRRRCRQDRPGDGTDPRHGREISTASPSSPASASARARATNCCTTCSGSGVLGNTVLVYGQMNEPPGARWRVRPQRASPSPSTTRRRSTATSSS